MPSPEAILAALDTVIEPHLGIGLDAAGLVKSILPANPPVVEIELGFPAVSSHAALAQAASEAVEQLCGVAPIVRISTAIHSYSQAKNLAPVPGVKNIIAVASGKGGVGKSTVAVNLALALAAEGATVGILDADIHGPSQPLMLGVAGIKPTSPDGTRMNPVPAHGLQAMSIGFLIADDQPMIWRGPMVTQALAQLINETVWREVDYLILDLPPGTGDIQLSLSQRMPVSGAIVVTTPQDIALLDARKGLQMFNKVGVPVLGIVENMATFCCPNCGHQEAIFGEGGAARMAQQYGSDVLGRLPLERAIREAADGGAPTVVSAPSSPAAAEYRRIARTAAARLAHGMTEPAFPTISVE